MSKFNVLGLLREEPYMPSFFNKVVQFKYFDDECQKTLVTIRDDLFYMMNNWHGEGDILPSEWIKFLCREIKSGIPSSNEAYLELSKESFHKEMQQALINDQPIRAVGAFIVSCYHFFSMDLNDKMRLYQLDVSLGPWIEE